MPVKHHREAVCRRNLSFVCAAIADCIDAAALLEARGDLFGAIRLFLKGGVPGRAAAVVIRDAKNATNAP